MRALVLSLFALLPLLSPALAQVPTAPPPAATLTPAQAQDVLGVLQDDKKRAQFIAVLEDMAKALPAAKPAAPALVAPDSLGSEVLVQTGGLLRNLTAQFAAALEAVNTLPQLGVWFDSVANDPATRDRLLDSMWRLGLVLACAGAVEWVLIRLLRRPRRALGNHVPYDPPGAIEQASDSPVRARRFSVAWHMLRRLPFMLGALVLDVVPAMVFAITADAILGTSLGATANARLVVVAVVNGYVVGRVAVCVARAFFSPGDPRLRLVLCSDDTARYLVRWIRRLAVVALTGYTLAGVGSLYGLYPSAHDVVVKLFGLVIHAMLVVMVLQKRQALANRLRARHTASGLLARMQNGFAARWHLVAIFYIVALWLVAAAEIRDGYSRLLHFFVVTSVVGVLARLATIVVLGGLDRLIDLGPELRERFPQLQPRLHRYQPALRLLLLLALGLCTLVALFEVWGLNAVRWFGDGRLGERVLHALLTSAVAVAAAVVAWEAANAGIEQHLAALTRQAQIARATRLRTLLPILRATLFVTILLFAGLIVLSEVGVNVAPLLAGAGVLGVAIGFGSQKLVQDLITGLFLLLENTMQVGDVVALGGLTGTVETLSIRTIRLRALDGSVHIIPFSSVTTVTNQTRDFSYALIDLPVGLDEEPDHVVGIVRAICDDMRKEARWADAITADLDVLGVQAFGDNSWTLRLRIRTEPAQRWAVTREFNRRVKYRFDELVIQSPITGYKVQGWMPPGSERASPQPEEAHP